MTCLLREYFVQLSDGRTGLDRGFNSNGWYIIAMVLLPHESLEDFSSTTAFHPCSLSIALYRLQESLAYTLEETPTC